MTDPGALWVAALATGLRQGELLALRWDDVDVDTATLMSDPKRGHHRIARLPRPTSTCRGSGTHRC
jgi:integrase